MCHCITPEALLYGLIRRMETEGCEPTRQDVRGLIGSGCRVDVALSVVRERLDSDRAAKLCRMIEDVGT